MIVNKYWLIHIWGYIGEGNETDSIDIVDMSEKSNVLTLVEEYVRPYWNDLPQEIQIYLKATWKFALNNFSDRDLRRPLNNLLPPFETPVDVRGFYIDAWNLMFVGESWKIDDPTFYEVDDSTRSPWDYIDRDLN